MRVRQEVSKLLILSLTDASHEFYVKTRTEKALNGFKKLYSGTERCITEGRLLRSIQFFSAKC